MQYNFKKNQLFFIFIYFDTKMTHSDCIITIGKYKNFLLPPYYTLRYLSGYHRRHLFRGAFCLQKNAFILLCLRVTTTIILALPSRKKAPAILLRLTETYSSILIFTILRVPFHMYLHPKQN